MTEEELAAIEARASEAASPRSKSCNVCAYAHEDVRALLAEVRRLRGEPDRKWLDMVCDRCHVVFGVMCLPRDREPSPVRCDPCSSAKPLVLGCAGCQHPPHDQGPCPGEPGDPCDCDKPFAVYACERCGSFEINGCICYAR